MLEKHDTCPWNTVLQPLQTVAAIETARDVASRLRERPQVEDAVKAAEQQTTYPLTVHWQPHDIAQGYAGLAILFGYLAVCFPDEDWDVIAHQYIEIAARDAEEQSYHSALPSGLFSGLSGLAFAVCYLSQGGKRYNKLLAAIDEFLLPQAIALANTLEVAENISVNLFDLISGLSGVGTYLLSRRESPQALTALRAVLGSLTRLTEERNGRPRWYTPVHLLGEPTMMALYPYGNLNCGLAHGIPGPLGLLSLSSMCGVTVNGMEDAIERTANWLLQHHLDDEWGLNWPTAVKVKADGTVPVSVSKETTNSFEPSRTAWCYGSPGLARALWFAGQALDNKDFRDSAITAMEAVFRRPIPVRRIDSPTFCHGIAGLLQITLRFAHDTQLPQFAQAAQDLTEQLLSLYDPDSRLGYYSLQANGKPVDQPGLLDGAPGVALVLLAAATNIEPTWDHLFLLS